MKKQLLFSFFLLFFLSVTLLSCRHANRNVPVVPKKKLPKVQVKIHRYGKALFSLDLKNFQVGLKKIKPDFLPFLNADLNDTANINQLYRYVTDTQIRYVYQKTMKLFPQLNREQRHLQSAFAHLKYYYPSFSIPRVYSYISDLYYEQPVMKQGNSVVIALDDYLGEKFPLYIDLNIPQYHRRCMTKKNMVVDVVRTIYRSDFQLEYPSEDATGQYDGCRKRLYFLDAMLPGIPDTLKICYTTKPAGMDGRKTEKRCGQLW